VTARPAFPARRSYDESALDEVRTSTGGEMPEFRSRDRIQSIERGVAVLQAFSGRDAALSIVDLAARTGLSRPVVRRILLTFAHLGYAESRGPTWTLTPKVLEIGAGYFAASSLPEIAYRYMTEIVERTNDTCSLGVLDGHDVIHVARVEDRGPLPDAVRIGQRLPAHATALGKVLLAQLDQADLDAALATAPLEAHTPLTITSEGALRARLERVRRSGFDVSVEELYPGRVAVAVPISVDGRSVGGIGVSSTTVHETPHSLATVVMPMLRQAATSIAGAYRNANPQLFRHAGA
jgi:IclR family pca regulon transcriptional regulator